MLADKETSPVEYVAALVRATVSRREKAVQERKLWEATVEQHLEALRAFATRVHAQAKGLVIEVRLESGVLRDTRSILISFGSAVPVVALKLRDREVVSAHLPAHMSLDLQASGEVAVHYYAPVLEDLQGAKQGPELIETILPSSVNTTELQRLIVKLAERAAQEDWPAKPLKTQDDIV